MAIEPTLVKHHYLKVLTNGQKVIQQASFQDLVHRNCELAKECLRIEMESVEAEDKLRQEKLEDRQSQKMTIDQMRENYFENMKSMRKQKERLVAAKQNLEKQLKAYIMKDKLMPEIYKGPTSIVFEYLNLNWRDIL